MKSLFPLAVCCISLVSLQQLLALPVEDRPNRNRSDLFDKLIDRTEDEPSASGSQTHDAVAVTVTVPSPTPSRSPKWLPPFLRHQPASGATRKASRSLAWARPAEASGATRKASPSLAWARPAEASGATRKASPGLAWARPAEASERRAARTRRHAHSGSRGGHHYNNHHAKLMRVGCVLGTCQVQNLSHRLYQLIGQSGREDSSPINPRSPHSFG
ncbi:protein ADM2-like [Sebastes umbrosus]|uniref:protein ADM2-like n=1 Tax=Sebastes umbrosus TaxID=72105 RepID=UPI00189D4A83|nr:protein ADM2-like [Sebastes umbrosus]